jgi:DNA polymerase V
MNQALIALADCYNFFVRCERVFRHDLINKPVVVLSNNDVSYSGPRSQEAKDLRLKMAVPVHQVADVIHRHHIQLFSSNSVLTRI